MIHLGNHVNEENQNLLNSGFQGQFEIGLCFAHMKICVWGVGFFCI